MPFRSSEESLPTSAADASRTARRSPELLCADGIIISDLWWHFCGGRGKCAATAEGERNGSSGAEEASRSHHGSASSEKLPN